MSTDSGGTKPKRARKVFGPDEDQLLLRVIDMKGLSSWEKIAAEIPNRTARQCRDRWMNYLSPNNRNDPWTEEDDRKLIEKVNEIGTHWSVIAREMGNRSENCLKNRWYANLKARTKLTDQGDYELIEEGDCSKDFWDAQLLQKQKIETDKVTNPVDEVMFDCLSVL